MLNRESGLLGVSGVSNDFRAVSAAADEGNERAKLALRILANAIKKLIGAYTAEMNGIDVLVFTAGIGENQSNLRAMVCEDMDWFGVSIDAEKNAVRGEEINISAPGAKVQTWVVPTDEERMIALDTERIAKELA
jgi:acetate kinase